MPDNFENEQEQQNSDRFKEIVSRYEQLTDITPQQTHELIERIEVHAPKRPCGHRQQKVDIYFRLKVVKASAILERRDYDKRKRLRSA